MNLCFADLQIRFINGPSKTEIGMVGRYKQWLGMMSKHYPEAKMLWNEIKRLKKIDEINEKITIQLPVRKIKI
jgi:tRNA-dihydrouridine synthase C